MEKQYLDYEGFEHTIERLRRKEMPEPSVDYVGQIVQYVGGTTSDYIKGCFYECVSDGATTPTYSWEFKALGSKDAYEVAKGYGYPNKYESVFYKDIMNGTGHLANAMLGEMGKIQIAEAGVQCECNDSLVYDSVTNCLFWGGKDPSAPTSRKHGINKYNLTTGEFSFNELGIKDLPMGGTAGALERGVAFYGDYGFLTVRSSSSSPKDDQIWGYIICFNKNTLERMYYLAVNGRCVGINIYTTTAGIVYMMVNCQMSFYQLYRIDPSSPGTTPTLLETRYFKDYIGTVPSGAIKETVIQEQQRGCFYEKEDGTVYYIAAGFGDGVHIWDITNVKAAGDTATCVLHYSFPVRSTYHTEDCVISYPYIYATLGPESNKAKDDKNNGTNFRKMGLLTLDISNMSEMVDEYDTSKIKASYELIPVDDMNEYSGTYDTRPVLILMWQDKLFLGNGNKGMAIYDISKPDAPVYMGTKLLPGIYEIGGMTLAGDNIMYVGDWPIAGGDVSRSNPWYIKKYEIYAGYKGMFAGGETPEPTEDVYGALVKTGVLNDLSTYDPTTSVNVKDLGAVGDGVTDDSAAFIEAAYEASAHGKVNILIPHGVYNLNSSSITIPAGVSLIGESAGACIIKNANFAIPNGVIAKNLTFDGGAEKTVYSYPRNIIFYAIPEADTSEIVYQDCIFKNAHYASWAAMWHSGEDYNPSEGRYKIKSLTVRNCIFEDLTFSAIWHPLLMDEVLIENNVFRRIGKTNDTPFVEVSNPTGNPKSKGYWEHDDSPSAEYEWYPTEDTSVDGGHTYYRGIGNQIASALIGDTSGNTTNRVAECNIVDNTFEDIISNTYLNAPDNWDMCNFLAIYGYRVAITRNKFKDLNGYACDREGIYTKAIYCDISYNYLENAGLGEGCICCKGVVSVTNRSIHVHDNVIVAEGGRGIRTFGNAVVEDNSIIIANAKGGIWGSQNQRFVARNNFISLGFDHFYLTDPISAGREPTDYHTRNAGIECIESIEQTFEGNTVIMNVGSDFASTLHHAIRSQKPYYCTGILANHIITNAGSGADARQIRSITVEHTTSGTNTPRMKIDVDDNHIKGLYEPIRINISGLVNCKTAINIKNNYIEDTENVAIGNEGYEAVIYDVTNNETTLTYETVQGDDKYKSSVSQSTLRPAHVKTNTKYVETDNLDWILRR